MKEKRIIMTIESMLDSDTATASAEYFLVLTNNDKASEYYRLEIIEQEALEIMNMFDLSPSVGYENRTISEE